MRLGVVGAGRMGRRHVQAARVLGLEVMGICDISSESLAAAERELAIASDRQYRELSVMLERAQPECVVVATTAPTHCEYTCLAAEAGVRFILCEKPMAISLDQCERMIEVCRSHGTRLAVNHQMRFMDQYTAPKAIIDSDAFGGLRSVTVVAANFGLSMNGLHYFEMFRFMAGEAPRRVTAWFSSETVPNPRGPEFEDRAGSVRLVPASGKRFYLECGAEGRHRCTAPIQPEDELVEVVGQVFLAHPAVSAPDPRLEVSEDSMEP